MRRSDYLSPTRTQIRHTYRRGVNAGTCPEPSARCTTPRWPVAGRATRVREFAGGSRHALSLDKPPVRANSLLPSVRASSAD